MDSLVERTAKVGYICVLGYLDSFFVVGKVAGVNEDGRAIAIQDLFGDYITLARCDSIRVTDREFDEDALRENCSGEYLSVEVLKEAIIPYLSTALSNNNEEG